MDSPGIPLDILVLMVVVIPVCLAVLISMRAFHGMTPLVFRCRQCGREFLRKPHHSFPTKCPLCHARNWNT
jgi:Zn finger protein HypA/HybF involved in hydrogenase expression